MLWYCWFCESEGNTACEIPKPIILTCEGRKTIREQPPNKVQPENDTCQKQNSGFVACVCGVCVHSCVRICVCVCKMKYKGLMHYMHVLLSVTELARLLTWYLMIMRLTVGKTFLLIVSCPKERLLTFGTHKMLQFKQSPQRQYNHMEAAQPQTHISCFQFFK